MERSLAERLLDYLGIGEILDGGAGEGGAESEPAFRIWVGVVVVEKELAVHPVLHSALDVHQLDMVPAVGFEQVARVGVFLDDGRVRLSGVAAETGRGVAVASEPYVIELHLGAVGEHSVALGAALEDVLGHRVGGHPEAVEVAEAVSLLFVIDDGVVLDDDVPFHLLLVPEGQALGGDYLALPVLEADLVVGRFRFDFPELRELFFIESGNVFG